MKLMQYPIFIRQQILTPQYILKHEDLRHIVQAKDTIDDEYCSKFAEYVVMKRGSCS